MNKGPVLVLVLVPVLVGLAKNRDPFPVPVHVAVAGLPKNTQAPPLGTPQHVADPPNCTSPHALLPAAGTIAHKDSDPHTANSSPKPYFWRSDTETASPRHLDTGAETADRYDSSGGPKHAGSLQSTNSCWQELEMKSEFGVETGFSSC